MLQIVLIARIFNGQFEKIDLYVRVRGQSKNKEGEEETKNYQKARILMKEYQQVRLSIVCPSTGAHHLPSQVGHFFCVHKTQESMPLAVNDIKTPHAFLFHIDVVVMFTCAEFTLVTFVFDLAKVCAQLTYPDGYSVCAVQPMRKPSKIFAYQKTENRLLIIQLS